MRRLAAVVAWLLCVGAAHAQGPCVYHWYAAADPGATDDITPGGFCIDSLWTNTTTDNTFTCADATDGAAVWKQATGVKVDLLDGSVHQDTAAGTVVRGDVIVGDSTPEWSRLAIGGEGTLARSDGTDQVVLGPAVVSASAPSTTTGVIWLDTGSSAATGTWALRTETGTYTVVSTDQVILADASSAAFTVTLPAAAANSGRWFRVKKIDSSGNAVTVDGNGSETIDGDLNKIISAQYSAMLVVSDGSNWHIL